MVREMPNHDFIRKAVVLTLAAGTLGFALKFITYFENWCWLPTFPNIFDAVFLVLVAAALLFIGLSK